MYARVPWRQIGKKKIFDKDLSLNKVVLKYQNLNHIVFHIGMGYIYLVGPGYGFFEMVGSGSKSAPPGSITLGFKSSCFCNNKLFILLYLSFGSYTM